MVKISLIKEDSRLIGIAPCVVKVNHLKKVGKQHVKLAENFPYRLLKVMKSTLTLKG